MLEGSLFLFEGGVSEGVSLRTERGEWRDFRVKGWEIPFLFLCLPRGILAPFASGCYLSLRCCQKTNISVVSKASKVLIFGV